MIITGFQNLYDQETCFVMKLEGDREEFRGLGWLNLR